MLAWSLAQQGAHLMVFVNGHYEDELSSLGTFPPGVRLASLASLLEDGSELPAPFLASMQECSVFAALNTIVNVGRSLPFLILMAAIIPVTRFIVGTTIGIPAAIVPMTTAGVPFFARLVQNALREVRSDVTDMGQASGGTTLQVIRTVQLSEALPALAGALTVNVIAMIEYSRGIV